MEATEYRLKRDASALPPLNSETLVTTHRSMQQWMELVESKSAVWMNKMKKINKDLLDQKLVLKRQLMQGRLMIYVATFARPWNVVYGDTDSLFPHCPICFYHPTRYEQTGQPLMTRYMFWHSVWIMGMGLQDLVNPLYRFPMKMELEKWFSPLLMYCAKMYRYCDRTNYGALTKIKDTGLQTARRDISDFNKSILLKMLDAITWFQPEKALKVFVEQAQRMEHPETLDHHEFIRTVSRKRKYKLPNCYQVHLWNTMREKFKVECPVGTRVKFIVCRPPTNQPSLDWKRRLIDEDHFSRENAEAKAKGKKKPMHEVDLLYHFRLLVKSAVKLLGIFYSEEQVTKSIRHIETNLIRYQLHNHDITTYFSKVPKSTAAAVVDMDFESLE